MSQPQRGSNDKLQRTISNAAIKRLLNVKLTLFMSHNYTWLFLKTGIISGIIGKYLHCQKALLETKMAD